MRPNPPVGIFFALFTVSGFAGLIYQSIWSHYLKLFLGHAAYAQTLVLAIFMGGMALGAWLVARFTARLRNLLVNYAIAELAIGVLALVFHPVFVAATGWAYDTALPALGGTGIDLFKWSLAAAVILPASILLGTTFPLMSAGILRIYPDQGGRALSMLYFTNSFGAAAGVLASGFVLIERVGLPGTLLTAGLMNIALGILVWGLAKRTPATNAAPASAASAHASSRPSEAFVRAILVLALVTGTASFIYEITWIRMLTLAIGASTHSFEVMLAAFILSMSLGAYWFRNRIATIGDHSAWLVGLLVAKAVFAAGAVWIYPEVLQFVGWTMRAAARTEAGYTFFTLAGFAASALMMFPTAFCAGMTLPLATHALTSRGSGEDAIGKVYAANTAGCIVGAAFATHLGMEWLGVRGLTALGASLDLAVGLLVLFAGQQLIRRRAWATGVAVAGVGAVALFATADLDLVKMASGVYRQGVFDAPGSELPFYRDGKTATISIKRRDSRVSIRTNGKPDASVEMDASKPMTPDEITMTAAAALPLAMNPEARRAAVVGLGSGLTTHVLLASTKLEEVDTIEIERMVIDAARHFSPRNDRAYRDPRSRIHIEDAKTFFAGRSRKYDIIVSEPSNPWVSGVSTLYSEEFYAHTRRYLAEGGLLVQWVQAYEIDTGLLSSIFKALGKHYGDYAVYRNSSDTIIVATSGGKLPPLDPAAMAFPALAADLAYLGIGSVQDLEAMRIGGRRALEPLWERAAIPANSDYFPVLDRNSAQARFENRNAGDLLEMRNGLVPVLPLLDGDVRFKAAALRKVGMNRPPRVHQALAGAEALDIALRGRADSAQMLDAEDLASATLAHNLAASCPDSSAQWVTAITRVAHLSVPFLEAGDVAPLFQRARSSPCGKTLDEMGTRRLALLEAINARDAKAIAEHALWVVSKLPRQLESERVFLVEAALAGAVVSRDLEALKVIATRYLPTLPRSEREGAMVQLLSGHAVRIAR